MPLDLSITTEEKINVKIAPVTSQGKPATLDGAPTWEVVSGNGTVEAAADGLSAFIVSGDSPDSIVVRVSADADLGAGVTTIEDIITTTVTNAQAAALGITNDAAIPK